jgi:transposase-like protein
MKANVKLIRKKRSYSKEFKQKLVQEFEGGNYSVHQLGLLHNIKPQVIYNWIYKFSKFNEKGYRVVEQNESSKMKVNEMEKRIQDLEAMLGRKQIIIDYYDKMFDLAKEELNIDIKKNYGTRPSSLSEKTLGR